jgi:hypothetical protein
MTRRILRVKRLRELLAEHGPCRAGPPPAGGPACQQAAGVGATGQSPAPTVRQMSGSGRYVPLPPGAPGSYSVAVDNYTGVRASICCRRKTVRDSDDRPLPVVLVRALESNLPNQYFECIGGRAVTLRAADESRSVTLCHFFRYTSDVGPTNSKIGTSLSRRVWHSNHRRLCLGRVLK